MTINLRGPIATLGALALGAAVLSACGSSGQSNTAAASQGSGSFDTSACPAAATAAISGDTITLGTSGPLSGPYASVGALTKAIQAYASLVDSQGGVDTVDGKKKLKIIAMDDQYTPSKVQSNVRQMVEKDHVAGVLELVGTANAAAVAPYLNQQCVPELFPLAGAASLLSGRTPFTTIASTYLDQGNAMGQFVAKHYPDAKVAVLYQNDDTGKDALSGFAAGAAGSKAHIVAKESYEVTDADVKSQMTTLQSTKADVFVDLSLSVKCTQSLAALQASSWRPAVITGSMCSAGVVSAADAPDATSQMFRTNQTKSSPVKFANDAAFKTFHDTLTAAGIAPGDAETAWLSFQLGLAAIEKATTLSSVGIAEAARSLPADTSVPFAEDGIAVSSTPGKPTLRAFTLDKWDGANAQFVPTGETPYQVSN
ncbi:ABC transporter substrate-binding protein [Nocardioides sp. Iso805N]|uniref:ABC transporter substrate-binding protein n=1 Tax=Nocardioides sp. Iso805N TaxID=1283287 RepID=UPI000369A232|nr:ABC transporter substrate-binding protein [Nocardioides sp. Iso805N]